MPYLVRKINRSKWESKIDDDICADAITACLRTQNNTLSVWKIESKEEINNVILALSTGSNQEKVATINYILFDYEEVNKSGLILKSTKGDTALKSAIENHLDFTDLNYIRLGKVKDLILDCIANKNTGIFTRSQIIKMLKKAIEDQKINVQDLNQRLLNDIGL